MPKISSLIIALSVVGVIVILFSLGMVSINTQYGTTFNPNASAGMNKSQELITLGQQLRANVSAIKDNANYIDKVSAFFSAGFISLKYSMTSIDTAQAVGSDAIKQIPIYDPSGKIHGAILGLMATIIIILIVFGVIMYSITKTPT